MAIATPAPRNSMIYVYDPVRDVIIMQNGNGASFFSDGAEYDVPTRQWVKLTTPLTPTRLGAAHAWDANRNKAVAWGGWTGSAFINDVVEYDPVAAKWNLVTMNSNVTPWDNDSGPALNYDPVRHTLIEFGGLYSGVNGDNLLREYDPVAKTGVTRNPVSPPSARDAAVFIYQPWKAKYLMFGGSSINSGGTFYNDTWEYDSATNTWAQLAPTHSPSPRRGCCYFVLNNKVILFGGLNPAQNAVFQEQWEWDGTDWHLSPLTYLPAGRYIAGSAVATSINHAFIFGGNYPGVNLNDTWEYDGVQWIGTPVDRRFVSPIIGKPPRVNKKSRLLSPLLGWRPVLNARSKSAVLGAITKSTPSVRNISPAVGIQIGVGDHILFDLIDIHGFQYISIKTPGPDGKSELIYDGIFSTQYTGSIVSTITSGFHFDIVRSGGWLVPPNLTIVAINNDGVAL